MKKILILMASAAFLFLASIAFAQETVNMYFNGNYQGGTVEGAGAGFYDGSINGVNVGPSDPSPGMICDDYYDHISGGEGWTATAYQVSSLNAGNIGADTLFGGDAGWGTVFHITGYQGYEALAYLVNDMFVNGVGNSSLQADISSALWYLTSNASTGGSGIALSSLSANAQALVNSVLAAIAGGTIASLSSYANLWLYTQPFAPPGVQEMWGLTPVPEGGAALLYLLLAGGSCFGAMFFRSRNQVSRPGIA